MKYLIFFVSFILQQQSVKCDGGYLADKINDFAYEVTKVYNNVVNSIKNIFTRSITQTEEDVEQYILEEKVKQSFNDFVQKTASLSDSSGASALRSEPTALMSTVQLAAVHGRSIESHVIKTKDNYLLTLHRISNKSHIQDKTVILHHGLLGSSADWVLLGPTKSLPYILSDAGYDVWMANARGNYYSRGHLLERVNSSKYWKFSFQEMGQYDLPATIDYIRKFKPLDEKLNYVGHSIGATALLVLLSTYPQYNDYLRVGVLLAPLAFMSNAQGPLKLFHSMSDKPPNNLLKMIGDTEFVPSRSIPKVMATKFCTGSKVFCYNPLFFLTGGIRVDEIADSFLARLLYHVPAGASTNTIMHLGQLVLNGKFHKFRERNSEFGLYRVTVPIALLCSTDDWLSTMPDVMRLYFSISNPIEHYVIRDKNISHTEFVWGYDADKLIYPKVLQIIKRGPDYKPNEKENEVN